jgi:hypothetical protein
MMERWSYSDYKKSILDSINQAKEELGFTIDQAIGYAGYDLELKLSECPDETVLAMVALGKAIIDNSAISLFPKDSGFCSEIRDAILDKNAYPEIQGEELTSFAADMKLVLELLSI